MRTRTIFSIAVFLALVLFSSMTAPASFAESIDAAEVLAITCDGFTIGTRSDPGTVYFQFQIQRTNPAGPIATVSGSFQQTVAKPGSQITAFSWGSFPAVPYVLSDGTLDGGDYVVVNSPQDDPVGRTATLGGFNTIPLHYSAGPLVCEAPPSVGEGCTPGFWKQPQHLSYWVGWAPGDLFDAVFGVNAFPGKTLFEVVSMNGGGINALGRHAVAALLNASSPDVNYYYTVGEVINLVHDAIVSGNRTAITNAKNLLEDQNADETICPLQ